MEIALTLQMKSACLDWLRFDRRCITFATEVGPFSSDVLGYGKSLYEIEIKTSKSDFMADFKKKKHIRYSDGHYWTPDYFYFCIPSSMVIWAVDLMKEKNLPYGIMEHCPNKRSLRNCVKVQLRAKRMKPKSQNIDLIVRTIKLRMGSDICRIYHKLIRPQEDNK